MQREPGENILEKLRAGYFLPSLSVVATKLIELASSENSSVKDLVDLIEKDPSLTVRILKLANTAFFRISDPVTSVEQAVFRIGFSRLRIMALSLSLRDTFPMGRRGPMDYEKFWKVSLYKALFSKSLARYRRDCNADEAFAAGLIQEIGLLILFDHFIKGRDEMVKLDLYPLKSLLTFEKERYGIDHREIGEAALRYWQFPESIIMCQHLREGESEKDPSPLCQSCEIARILSSIIFQESMSLNDMLIRVEKTYNLNHDVIVDVLFTTFDEVEEIAVDFSVDVNIGKDVLEILEKANKVLAELSERASRDQYSSPVNTLPTFQSLDIEKDQRTVKHTLDAVAHEIRNPLTTVGGFVKKLSSVLDSSSEGWQYMQIILEESKKLEQALSRMTRKSPMPLE